MLGQGIFTLASYKKHTLKLSIIDFQNSNRETELELTIRNAPQLNRSLAQSMPQRNALEIPTGNGERAINSCCELRVPSPVAPN